MSDGIGHEVVIPELVPSAFIEATGLDEIPEQRIYKQALDTCKHTISRLVIADEFDPALVPIALRVGLEDRGIDSLVTAAAREEITYSYVGTSLLAAYGLERPVEPYTHDGYWQGPLYLPVPQEFADDLFEQAGNLEVDFSLLARMHEVYGTTKIPKFLRLATSIFDGEFDDTEAVSSAAATDELFALSEQALFSEDYTLPLDHDDMTYMLCFVPYMARRMFKQVMIANQIAQRMASYGGMSELSDDDQRMFDSIKTIMGGEALTSQAWYEFVGNHGASDETKWRMANHAANVIDAQRTAQSLRDATLGLKVVAAFELARTELLDRLQDIARADRSLSPFANSDIGHGLDLFHVYGVMWSVGEYVSNREFVNIEKDGRTAVIFEDDQRQAALWKRLANDYSSSTAEEKDIYDDAAAFLEAATDPNVGLCMVDIEDVNGDPVGLELAEAIIRHKAMQPPFVLVGPDPSPKFEIIVWSNSPKRVKEACKYLKPVAQSLGIAHLLLGAGSINNSRIRLTVKHKLPSINDLHDASRR